MEANNTDTIIYAMRQEKSMSIRDFVVFNLNTI